MSTTGSQSPADGKGTLSSLACLICKRRKVRCDRTLPRCQVCTRTHQDCSYPSAPNKPGPKPGSTQRNLKRRQLTSPESPTKNRKNSDSETNNSRWMDSASPVQSPEGIKQEGKALPSRPAKGATDRGSLSYIIHPSHERASPPPRSSDMPRPVPSSDVMMNYWHNWVLALCQQLGINIPTYQLLLHSFLQKFRAFSLFHRPSFESKLANLQCQKHYQAFALAVLSIGIRFELKSGTIQMPQETQDYCLQTAIELLHSCLDDFVDTPPPLYILQGMILTLFQQLTTGVRGKAWRDLGVCMRIAYELELHLVDTDERKAALNPDAQLDEERRRTWWVLWEFDVFASCIRRLPTAIDWMCNKTLLPIPDEIWFAGETCKSCFLEPDLRLRWKVLQKSGNQSPTAWFIVINSLMRSAQLLYNFPGQHNSTTIKTNAERQDAISKTLAAQEEDQWHVINNTLSSIMMTMPDHLSYTDEYLAFRPATNAGQPDTLAVDSAKYSIHLMSQLVRFMLYHHRSFSGPALERNADDKNGPGGHASPQSTQSQGKDYTIDRQAWAQYHDAASRIVSVVRNSNRDHILYVNPFLANTIWFAAAAQVVFRLFGFPEPNHSITESNFDLLRSSFIAFANFWGVSKNLEHNLDTLETRLQRLGQEDSQTPSTSTFNRNEIYPTSQPVVPMGQDVGYAEGEVHATFGHDLFNQDFYYDWDLGHLINYGGM